MRNRLVKEVNMCGTSPISIEPIYLDHNATTPCAPEVVEAILPYFSYDYGNPSSQHLMGKVAADAIFESRKKVATAIGCREDEIVFTSGATESNNIILLGISQRNKKKKKIIVSSIEHQSILKPCLWLSEHGFEITRIPVHKSGIIDIDAAIHEIDDSTFLVVVQGANNEVGTLQPVAEIADKAHAKGALVHCDATQLLGKMSFSLCELKADTLSFSAHKAYGPKGVGCIVLASQEAKKRFHPVFFGGGQEFGLRPSTLNVPGIVGFGVACSLITETIDREAERITALRDDFERKLLLNVPQAEINCAEAPRLPGTSSVILPNIPADMLISNMPRICISNGSACSSGSPAPSYVIRAIGVDSEKAECAFRVSFGRYNTPQHVDIAVDEIRNATERLSAALKDI